jgi:hypothetical protein
MPRQGCRGLIAEAISTAGSDKGIRECCLNPGNEVSFASMFLKKLDNTGRTYSPVFLTQNLHKFAYQSVNRNRFFWGLNNFWHKASLLVVTEITL